MQRVLIVGLGLIGGSIGLALRRWSEERKVDGRKPLEVIGFDPNLDHQRAAENAAPGRVRFDLVREPDTFVVEAADGQSRHVVGLSDYDGEPCWLSVRKVRFEGMDGEVFWQEYPSDSLDTVADLLALCSE